MADHSTDGACQTRARRMIKRREVMSLGPTSLTRFLVKTRASVNGTPRKTAQATIMVGGRVLDQVKNEPLERGGAFWISITAG
jgi:hypothetical protein